jgi:hypothetical protein
MDEDGRTAQPVNQHQTHLRRNGFVIATNLRVETIEIYELAGECIDKMDKYPWKPRHVHNGSDRLGKFTTKILCFDSIEWVSLVLSADGNTNIYRPF